MFCTHTALTYVDLDDENDSLDTPPVHQGHGMPKVKAAAPAITEDVMSPKEEVPPPSKPHAFIDYTLISYSTSN